MEIPKEKLNRIEEIRKYIKEYKYEKPKSIEKVVDYVLDKCSTPEKQESFVAGCVMATNTVMYDTVKTIASIFSYD